MSIGIRDAVPADAPAILMLIKELADYEKLLDEVVATEENVIATLFCDAPKAFCLIAERNGEVAGFALYFFNFSTFLGRHGIYLEDLFVKPGERGGGIGKLLLSRLAAIAVEKGCGRLEWTVLDWNEPAIKFYRSIGAVAMDGWTTNRVTGSALEELAREAI